MNRIDLFPTREVVSALVRYVVDTREKKLIKDIDRAEKREGNILSLYLKQCVDAHYQGIRMEYITHKDFDGYFYLAIVDKLSDTILQRCNDSFAYREEFLVFYEYLVYPQIVLKFPVLKFDHQDKFDERGAQIIIYRSGKFYDLNQREEARVRAELGQIVTYEPTGFIRGKAQELIDKIDKKHKVGQLSVSDLDLVGAVSEMPESGLAIVEGVDQLEELTLVQKLRGLFNRKNVKLENYLVLS